MNETVEITRYPNRRLYDRTRKKYITVGEIEAMVLGGENVRVRDSKTDEDLTRMILTQILLERHPDRMKMFPVAFLHEILRADRLSLDWLTVYFGQAKSLMNGVSGPVGQNLVPGIDFWRSLMPNAASRAEVDVASPPDPNDEHDSADLETVERNDQQKMSSRLEELERRLKQLEGKGD